LIFIIVAKPYHDKFAQAIAAQNSLVNYFARETGKTAPKFDNRNSGASPLRGDRAIRSYENASVFIPLLSLAQLNALSAR
jgi:hypothetical protein